MKLFQVLTNLVSQFKSMLTKSASNGKEINLTSDNMTIKSTNFNVDNNGKITLLDDGSEQNANLLVKSKNNSNINSTVWSYGINSKYTGGIEGYFHAFNFGIQKSLGEKNLYGITGRIQDANGRENVELRLFGSNDNTTILTPDNITTPKLTQTSLAEQKKNFEKMQDNALDIIKGIDIYKYNLKSEKDTDKKHIGFVIGKEYNYSKEVTSIENDGVDNYSFTSLCCKAIQELQKMIEQLQKEIKEVQHE